MKRNLRFTVALALAALIPSVASSAMTGDSGSAAQAAGSRQFSAEAKLPTGEPISAVIVADPADEGRARAALSSAMSRAQQFSGEFFSEGGVASRLDSLGKGEKLELSPTAFDFLQRAVTLSQQSDGFFDVAGPSPKRMFTKSDSRRIELDGATRTVSFRDSDMKLDLTKIALGFTCDLMMETIAGEGFANASASAGPVTRNIGRDIYTPWDIVVGFGERTETGAHRAYRYGVSNVSATTVTPEGLGRGLTDPINKSQVSWGDSLRSVTVIASNAMTATAFALAAYTVGPKYAMKYVTGHPSVKGIVVDGQGNLTASKGMIVEGLSYEKSVNEQTASDGGSNDLKQKEREEAAQ
ncbi:MAG: FAD:protein FMN transferase [Proteobacteria bacterium]|nr:FAD:protein FMN transferase [Pseudomonadota bacterium]